MPADKSGSYYGAIIPKLLRGLTFLMGEVYSGSGFLKVGVLMLKGLRKEAFLALVVVLLGSVVAFGQEDKKADGVQVEFSVFRVVINAEGKEVLEPGDKAKPGETLEYQAVYVNNGTEGVTALHAILPIPKEMVYAAGTADPASVQASLDGKKYENVPLMRKVKLPDGKTEMREVPYEEYRFLLWNVARLDAKQSITTHARMRLGHGVAPHSAAGDAVESAVKSAVKSNGMPPKE